MYTYTVFEPKIIREVAVDNKLTEKQKKVLEFINEYANFNGYPPSIRDIAEHFNIKSPSGAKKHIDVLVRKGYLKRNKGARTIRGSHLYRGNIRMVPLVGKVAAGKPIIAIENVMGEVPLPEGITGGSNNVFILEVEGESMINIGIGSGDYVVVRQQSIADNGDIIVAIIDGEATVKRFKRRDDEIILYPENDTMKPIHISGGDLNIAGKVVSVIKMIDKKRSLL